MRKIAILGMLGLMLWASLAHASQPKKFNPFTSKPDYVGVDDESQISDLGCGNSEILKWNDGLGVWACASDATGAGGDQLVDIVTTAPLLVNGGAFKNDALPGADADITWSIPMADASVNGYMQAISMVSIDVLVGVSHPAVTVAAGENYLSLGAGQVLTAGTINDTNMTAEDFGDFTCDSNEDGCLVDADAVALATDTTGNYVATITGTTNQVAVAGSGSENASVTLSVPATLSTTNVSADTVSVDELIAIWDSDNTHHTFIRGGNQAADVNYTLPTTDGDANQFLQTNGSGVLTWAAGGAAAGDIEAVYGCTSGDCSDLTGVAGDKLDLKDADSSIPWPTKTPEPTTEGMAMWKPADDTLKVGNGVGTETFYPGGTMTNDNFCKYDSAGLEIDCSTAANAGTDITADLEEETHVSEHQENGADELLGETLGTACSENQILKANATGGLDCAADDTGSSGSSKWRHEFYVQGAKLPLLNPMALDAGKSYFRALADATTPERLSFDTMLPSTYTGGAVSFDIAFSSSAAPAGTNDGIVWVVMNQCIASNDTNMIIDGQDEPHFYAQVFAPCKAPQAIGNFYRVGVPIPSASWDTVCGANSLLRIMVSRDTTSADDTYASDAELVKVVMYEI